MAMKMMKSSVNSRAMGSKVQARPAVAPRPTRPAARMSCNAFKVTLKMPRCDAWVGSGDGCACEEEAV